MDRKFPPIFEQLAGAYGVKKAFVSVIDSVNPNECKNCGGVGTLTLFTATKGPFQFPSGNREECNKYEDGVGWWVGQHHSAACPVCDGVGVFLSAKTPKPRDIKFVYKQSALGMSDKKQITDSFRKEALERGEDVP